ncbi:MAG: hypothetical protein JWP01_2232 [Myxococcales bacterium]|nr:hypothetical protein [Myxococcales bacterium]
MTKVLAVLLLSLGACGSKSKAAESPVGGPGEPAIDPTLPSWAPASCTTYQKAVFQAISCEAIDQGKRDEIQTTYNTASTGWKAESDADTARIAEVEATCTASADSVKVEIEGKCTK